MSAGVRGERDLKTPRAQRKKGGAEKESGTTDVIGRTARGSVRASFLLASISKQHQLLVGLKDRLARRDELVKVYTNKKVRFSRNRALHKAEQLRKNKDKVRAPNATQRVNGVDITPRMQGKLNVKDVRASERVSFYREIQLVYAAMDPPQVIADDDMKATFAQVKQLMKAGLCDEAKGSFTPETEYMIDHFESIAERGFKK